MHYAHLGKSVKAQNKLVAMDLFLQHPSLGLWKGWDWCIAWVPMVKLPSPFFSRQVVIQTVPELMMMGPWPFFDLLTDHWSRALLQPHSPTMWPTRSWFSIFNPKFIGDPQRFPWRSALVSFFPWSPCARPRNCRGQGSARSAMPPAWRARQSSGRRITRQRTRWDMGGYHRDRKKWVPKLGVPRYFHPIYGILHYKPSILGYPYFRKPLNGNYFFCCCLYLFVL